MNHIHYIISYSSKHKTESPVFFYSVLTNRHYFYLTFGLVLFLGWACKVHIWLFSSCILKKKKIQIILLENRRGNYWNIHYCLLYQGNNEDPLGKLVLNCKILMPVKLLNNITHLFIHTYFKKLQQLYSNFSTQLQHYSNFSTKEPSVIVNILNSVTTLLMLLKIYSLW